MRKLASIQRIWQIEPIEGADRIELAHVLGWQCVVNKGQFQPMDLAVYFEVDSFLPVREEFEFMRASSYRKTDIMGEGFRLRTMKFRGQISQGLLLPVGMFPEIPEEAELGMDVTEILGVRKWEIEERISTGGTMIGTLPYDIPHTDETRVQAEPCFLQALFTVFFASPFYKKLQSFFAECCDCILQRFAGLHCKPIVTPHSCQPDCIWVGLSCQ